MAETLGQKPYGRNPKAETLWPNCGKNVARLADEFSRLADEFSRLADEFSRLAGEFH